MLNTEIITEIKEIWKIKHFWNDLLKESNYGNLFCSFEWITTWWQHFGKDKKVYAILVKDIEKIIGIAPLMIIEERKKKIYMKCLSFIGQSGSGLCPDHIDIIVKPGHENEAVKEIINAILANNNDWDKISFSGVAEDSLFYKILIEELNKKKHKYYSEISSISPYAILPSEKNEKKWKYYQRRLSKDAAIKMEHLSQKEDMVRGLNIVKNLVINSAKRNNRGSDWEDNRYCAFHNGLLDKLSDINTASIAILYYNDAPVSVLYGFTYKKKYLLYSTGFDSDFASYSVSQILIGVFSNYLVEHGLATEFDFLRGNENYKYKWTDVDRKDKSVYFYAKNIKGRSINLIEKIYRAYMMLIHKA